VTSVLELPRARRIRLTAVKVFAMRRMFVLMFILMACLVLCAPLFAQAPHMMISAGAPAGSKLIWILGADGKLSAYDGVDFRLRMSGLALPPEARNHPENISISRSRMAIYADLVPGTRLRRLWSTNNYAHELMGGAEDSRPARGGGFLVTSATPTVYFSDGGERFFWFENRISVVQHGGDVSRTGEFLSWTTNFQGEHPKPVVSFPFAPCTCGTGACEETCPEVATWAPPAGISDFFFLTRWIPGQLSPEFLETDLYRAVNGIWTAHKLAGPVEGLLDAAGHGDTYIGVISDAGCCSWVNESDDVTYLVRDGKRVNIFDERARFHNNDYDVSFFTPKALFSPDVRHIAYTIAATQELGKQIRLSSEGKSNPEELRQIQAALAELPRVEVVALSDFSKPQASLANTELVGWLDAQHLLVLQHGELFAIDVTNGLSVPTGLKAAKAAYVFLR
jgi:hypothetical protein